MWQGIEAPDQYNLGPLLKHKGQNGKVSFRSLTLQLRLDKATGLQNPKFPQQSLEDMFFLSDWEEESGRSCFQSMYSGVLGEDERLDAALVNLENQPCLLHNLA